MQVVFDGTHFISGVALQGVPNGGLQPTRYISEYCVYIHDGRGWKTTLDDGKTWAFFEGECQHFVGMPTAAQGEVEFHTPVESQMVKIVAKAWVPPDLPPATQLGIMEKTGTITTNNFNKYF